MPGAEASHLPERVLVSLLALGAVAGPFLLRSLDDNRLTSWRWVFAEGDPARLLALAAAAILLAQLLARLPLPGRRPGAVLFLASWGVAACFWGEPELIVDASRYFTQAKHLEVYGLGHFLAEWGRGIPAWTDLPLVPLLYGLVFALCGESRVFAQAFTTTLFAASVLLTYRIGKALWDEETGFAAGALLLAIPYLPTQVPLLLVDVPTMFFLALAFFAVGGALERGGWARIALASLAVSLAFLSKYSSWILLSGLPAMAVVRGREGAPGPRRAGLAIALLSGSLVAALALSRREVLAAQVSLLLGYQAPGLRRWGESFASTFLFQVHPFLSAAALLSAWVAIRRRDRRWAVVAWPVLLLAAFQVRRIRYWIPAFPMLALLGAYGLQAIGAREVRKLVVACAVACSLVVSLHGYLPFLRSTGAANLQRAGEYLDSVGEGRVEVFALAGERPEVNPAVSVPILDLFTARRLTYVHEGTARPADGLETSALRFTWEYRNPAYYSAPPGGGGSAAIAVVFDEAGRPFPEGLQARLAGRRPDRTFDADEGIFRHRTLVHVYRLEGGTAGGLAPRPP